MNYSAVLQRLNLIIVLLLVIIAILLWPIVPRLLFVAGSVLFAGIAGLLIWGLTRAYQ